MFNKVEITSYKRCIDNWIKGSTNQTRANYMLHDAILTSFIHSPTYLGQDYHHHSRKYKILCIELLDNKDKNKSLLYIKSDIPFIRYIAIHNIKNQ